MQYRLFCIVSRYHSYLNSAKKIIQHYHGDEPFATFLKKFFSTEKKYGSKDRKQIAQLCYCYFRLGKALPGSDIEERILTGLYFCSNEPNEMLGQLRPSWNVAVHLSLREKCSMLNDQFSILNVFPWHEELSENIEYEKFCDSFLIQPDVYLRLRPGFEETVKRKLSEASIAFEEINSNCVAIRQGLKVENIVALDKEAVVQDLNSQRVGELMFVRPGRSDEVGPSDDVWDCCAGSGGKSILAYDMNPKIRLTVSDSRESIIQNLKKRFASAGIKKYKSQVLDLSNPPFTIHDSRFTTHDSPYDLIICDAPCTGSGTWSRTPEQLYFFDLKKIEQYASLQKKIIANAIPRLKDGGNFLYITCSVFKKENEANVEFISKQFNCHVEKMELLKGYDKKADTLFAALFKKITT
jgi:16S rRNA (cytosine967-C5)-methyltransferase